MKTTAAERSASGQLTTFFLPAERASDDEVAAVAESIATDAVLRTVLEAVDGYLLVLDENRQVLAANRAFVELVGLEDDLPMRGMRPGEVQRCIHAPMAPSGCGTGEACRGCGAAIAIYLNARSGESVERECLLTVTAGDQDEAREYNVRCSSFQVDGHDLTAFVLHDISDQKRRAAMEQVFFHDVLNTIGGLYGWGRLLGQLDGVRREEAAARIVALTEQLTTEVRGQRQLALAEAGELEAARELVGVAEIVELLRATFSASAIGEGRLVVEVEAGDTLWSDRGLLVRVLTNMVKNALEASSADEPVVLRVTGSDDDVVFEVHNCSTIPKAVALRIFQRSFTTKDGAGRGLGTYSMKIFGERFLGGQVSFTTSEEDGTVFRFSVPRGGP